MEALGEEADCAPAVAPQPGRWRANLRAALVETASRVTVAVTSAQELLRDRDLRRRGAAALIVRAQEGLQAIGKQISSSVGLVNKQQLAVRDCVQLV